MFGRKRPKPTFVEASPSLRDRIARLAGRARIGELTAPGGFRRWFWLPWILLAAPLRMLFHGLNSLLLRGGQVGAGLRSRQWRHLFLGLPAFATAIGVFIVGGIVLGREDGLSDVYQKEAAQAFAAEEYDRARLYFERMFMMDDGSAETRLYLGLALDELGQSREAMHLINGVAEGDAGGDFRANAWVAKKLMDDRESRQNPETRATIYRNLLKAHRGLPRNLEVKLNLAKFHLNEGKFRKAIPYLEQAAEIDAVRNIDLARLYAFDGRTNSAKTAWERAESHLRKKLDKKPVDQQTRAQLATTLLMQGEFAPALEILEQGETLSPNGPFRPLMAQAHVLIHDRLAQAPNRDYTAMMWHLRQALTLQPGLKPAIRRLVAFGETTPDDADDVVPASVESNAVDPKIQNEATEMLRRMLAEGNQAPTVHMALGLKAWRTGEAETALQHFEAAYNLDPSIAQIANNLAWILTHQSVPRPKRALAIINSVIERHPQKHSYRDTRGEVYLALERWDEAIRDLEYALPALKQDPRIHLSLAKAYEARGQTELAQSHRREAERLRRNSAPLDAEQKDIDAVVD